MASVTLRAQQEREAAQAKVEAEVSRAQEKEEKWREKFHQAEAELTDLRRERDHLRALVEGESDKPEPKVGV